VAEREIDISHETVRFWWNRFGPMFAAEIRGSVHGGGVICGGIGGGKNAPIREWSWGGHRGRRSRVVLFDFTLTGRTTMTEERLPLNELLQKAVDGDFLRAVAESVLQLLMEADGAGLIGAGRHERAADRLTRRGSVANFAADGVPV
jgi:hypothetical protein